MLISTQSAKVVAFERLAQFGIVLRCLGQEMHLHAKCTMHAKILSRKKFFSKMVLFYSLTVDKDPGVDLQIECYWVHVRTIVEQTLGLIKLIDS